jgi:hypothetical protein
VLDTAVVLLIFNRPQLTERVFQEVASARPARLLVVGDGPRPDHPEDERLVREARAVIERVDWPCEVSTCYADANLGCGRRVASGLDWAFSLVEEAIILEDDCVPDPTFFPFCNELLSRFRDDERVQMISGCNVVEQHSFAPESYCFSRGYLIWGWATWARAWRHYDYAMRAWPYLRTTGWLRDHLRGSDGAEIVQLLFDETYAGRIRQWDFQWVLSGWLRDAVAVVPRVNLVTNIGHGAAGTHQRDPTHPLARLRTTPMAFPLRHPQELSVLEERDLALWESMRPQYPSMKKAAAFDRVFRRGAAIAERIRSLRSAQPW